jgi:ATP-dependent Clp protease adaptor protein ClpS
MSEANSTTPPLVTPTQTEPREETNTRRFPPYHVILLNDEDHSMEFVIAVLMNVFGWPMERAFEMMLEAHTSGRAVLWTGPKEVAELKAEQVQTYHETRDRDQAKLGPLGCVIEPAP